MISISLKPATLDAIERMRGDTQRSRWIEQMVEHLLPIHLGISRTEKFVQCEPCGKAWTVNAKLERSMLNHGHYYDCPNFLKFDCKEKLTIQERDLE